MRTIYWKRESMADGRILALIKEENGEGYYYKNGKWNEDYESVVKAKWEFDYEAITEEEAYKIMEQM